jgi:hypothetical protein
MVLSRSYAGTSPPCAQASSPACRSKSPKILTSRRGLRMESGSAVLEVADDGRGLGSPAIESGPQQHASARRGAGRCAHRHRGFAGAGNSRAGYRAHVSISAGQIGALPGATAARDRNGKPITSTLWLQAGPRYQRIHRPRADIFVASGVGAGLLLQAVPKRRQPTSAVRI